MNRRIFIRKTGLAVGGLMTLSSCGTPITAARRIRWTQEGGLFTSVTCDGHPMAQAQPLLKATCRTAGENAPAGPWHAAVEHRLRDSGKGAGEDVLEVMLTVRNTSDRPQRAELEFSTPARPSPRVEEQRVYLPLSAAALLQDKRFAALGVEFFLKNNDQPVGTNNFAAHYLEPMASFPAELKTRALLLAPVVDISHPRAPWHVALFTPSGQPMRFSSSGGNWHAGRQVTIAAGETFAQFCWLMVHTGDASRAWKAFHRLAHREDFPVPHWVREVRTHYFDFLSAAAGAAGWRGDGYDADQPHFREFRVGMATQHGYYPSIGDYIQPDRKSWLAMRGDKAGPAQMSLEKMRARIKSARAAGARAAVYMHAALFDDAAPYFKEMRDCVTVDGQGRAMSFGWQGPDSAGRTWRGSLASPRWRAHLLQQARWIMELLSPDAIVVDETFAGLGYDYHPGHAGPLSTGAIEFFRNLRALVRSFGNDRAVFGSDCSMSGFVMWLDGECGDHAYEHLLGHPLYAQPPVRYLAALGGKPWLPCAWDFQKMWDAQMKLARQTGAGVGVSNGWLEYTGLARLPGSVKSKMIADIKSLLAYPVS
jgi:hypothetical protein